MNAFFGSLRNPRSGKRERLAVGAGITTLTPSVYTVQRSAGPNKDPLPDSLPTGAIIQVIGSNAIDYTIDGTNPVTADATGFKAGQDDYIFLDTFQKVKNFKAVQSAAAAAIEVVYLYGN
jgi:hypothetical protein